MKTGRRRSGLFLVTGAVTVFMLLFSDAAYGATFTVTTTSDNDCSDFDCDLQSALNAAGNNGEGDTINISAGTYTTTVDTFTYNPTDDFPLTIRGAGATSTILDGNNSYQVMKITTPSTDTNTTITIENITVQNGRDSTVDGAGIEINANSASIIVRNCVFDNNQIPGTGADDGGAMSISTQTGDITIENSIFTNNFSEDSGGALDLSTSSGIITIKGNSFSNNTANTDDGGGIRFYTNSSDAVFESNVFENNQALDNRDGGGVYGYSFTGRIVFLNNVFYGNHSTDEGGAVNLTANDITFVNNTVYGNTAVSETGGAYLVGGGGTETYNVYNNIFWNNDGGGMGDELYILNSTTSTSNLYNNLFSLNANFNTPQSTVLYISDLTNYNHSGNITQDPLLQDPANGNYHLTQTSPAIDSGLNSAPSLPATDFEGSPRIFDGNADSSAVVDIGADEYFEYSVPAMTEWGMIIFVVISGLIAVYSMRKRVLYL